jgi:hypothetical protein
MYNWVVTPVTHQLLSGMILQVLFLGVSALQGHHYTSMLSVRLVAWHNFLCIASSGYVLCPFRIGKVMGCPISIQRLVFDLWDPLGPMACNGHQYATSPTSLLLYMLPYASAERVVSSNFAVSVQARSPKHRHQ